MRVAPPLFNPSNDMALAANVRQYFPPRRIQQMESDLASLSRFWPSGPWGWSLATKQRYRQMGVAQEELPSDEWLANMRRLSSREFACGYLRELLEESKSLESSRKLSKTLEDSRRLSNSSSFVGHEMRFCTSLAALPSRFLLPTSYLIFKSPWSSSGRGIVVSRGELDEAVRSRVEGMVRQQGGFLVDRFYEEKVLDFAMEFWVHGEDDVEFLGYSVFETGEHGTYSGNLVAPQEELEQIIFANEPCRMRHAALISYHRQHLGRLGYNGPVGIDMMLLADGRIHPVVEINLRMNMGILALLLQRKGVTEDQLLTPERPNGFVARICNRHLEIVYSQ